MAKGEGFARALWASLRRPASNPVVLKELRGRMRGARAFVILTLQLSAMSAFAGGVTFLYSLSANQNYNSTNLQALGKNIFAGIVFVQLLLACFITPAFTASAISGERERQTFDIVRTTLLSTPALLWGKLLAALAFIGLLMLAALPVQGLSFLLGGITAADMAIATLVVLATAFLFGTAGLFFSAVWRRTLGATVLTYAFALISTLGFPLLMWPWSMFGYAIYWPVSLQALGFYAQQALLSSNPFATAWFTQTTSESYQTYFYYTTSLYTNSGVAVILPALSPWLPFVVFASSVGAGLMWVSVALVRAAER